MEKYRIADEKIKTGWEYITIGKTKEGCDTWLSAWEDIKVLMEEEGLEDITQLQKEYEWTDFLSNYIQDLETELWNAGIHDETYFQKRIKYCLEMLDRCGTSDELLLQNTRRAIADSHFKLGNTEECNKLYRAWLDDDPDWGWGYIGWFDNYHQFSKEDTREKSLKAEEILTEALLRETLRDRPEVLDRACEFYENIGKPEKATKLQKELFILSKKSRSSSQMPLITPIKSVKIKTGRNDPCPCGSGNKYKRCCIDR